MFKFKTLAATLALVAMAGMAQAAPMVYTFEVNASGQLNGQGFTNTAVTVTLTGEASVRYRYPCSNCYPVLADTTLIEVAGLGSDSFLHPIVTVSTTFEGGYFAFSEPVSDWGIFFVAHPSALSYFLQTPHGPVSGLASGNPGRAFDTLSGGSFTFDTFDSLGTFTAVAAQVPEPATWALLLVGLVPLLRRRRA